MMKTAYFPDIDPFIFATIKFEKQIIGAHQTRATKNREN